MHPLQFGVVRRKDRTQRRSGLPIESPLDFYPRRLWEYAVTITRWLSLAAKYRAVMRWVVATDGALRHVDEALRVSAREAEEQSDFVQAFADKIPSTHGAPVRKAVAAE